MEDPCWFNQDLALFMADSAEIRARLNTLNQKLLATLETLPTPITSTQIMEQAEFLEGDDYSTLTRYPNLWEREISL